MRIIWIPLWANQWAQILQPLTRNILTQYDQILGVFDDGFPLVISNGKFWEQSYPPHETQSKR